MCQEPSIKLHSLHIRKSRKSNPNITKLTLLTLTVTVKRKSSPLLTNKFQHLHVSSSKIENTLCILGAISLVDSSLNVEHVRLYVMFLIFRHRLFLATMHQAGANHWLLCRGFFCCYFCFCCFENIDFSVVQCHMGISATVKRILFVSTVPYWDYAVLG